MCWAIDIVSGEQQNPGESIEVAETCNAHQFVDVTGGIGIAWYGRKYTKLRLRHFCSSLVRFVEKTNIRGRPVSPSSYNRQMIRVFEKIGPGGDRS
jgi:hypothetical protein